MGSPLEVPQIVDLVGLPIEVVPLDSPGVVSVTAWANAGAVVTLTWDEIAGSVMLRWIEAGKERLVLEREAASKISVREEGGQVLFRVWFDAGDVGGQLVVWVGEAIAVSDVILRK